MKGEKQKFCNRHHNIPWMNVYANKTSGNVHYKNGCNRDEKLRKHRLNLDNLIYALLSTKWCVFVFLLIIGSLVVNMRAAQHLQIDGPHILNCAFLAMGQGPMHHWTYPKRRSRCSRPVLGFWHWIKPHAENTWKRSRCSLFLDTLDAPWEIIWTFTPLVRRTRNTCQKMHSRNKNQHQNKIVVNKIRSKRMVTFL